MKKYSQSFFRFFLFYIFGFLAFTAATFVISVIYNGLNGWFPVLFPKYNFVTEPELAAKLSADLKLWAGALSVFILEFFAVKYDNARYEFIISKTDGFYTIKEGIPIYLSEYLAADIFAAVTVPLTTFALTFISISDDAPRLVQMLEDTLTSFISVPLSFTERAGMLGGALLLISVSLISRFVSAYAGLKRWRAVWLSDIGREGVA